MKILMAVAAAFAAGSAAAADWEITGDVRAGVVASDTRAPDGTESAAESVRARLRAGTAGALADGWRLSLRAATVLDSDGPGPSLWLEGYAPSPAGLAPGDVTIDTLAVEYAPAGSPWSLRFGRFQTAFELDGVAKKSLDRLDSPSFDVGWTDGAWLRRSAGGWTTHVIVQHNHRAGPTNALRAPLRFDDGGSRVGMFVGLETGTPAGAIVQRMVAVTWLPDALPAAGGARDDYVAFTARAAAAWPLGTRRLLIGGEAGHASATDGAGWQASANLVDAWPAHDVGIVFGRLDDGWLVSPDFRPDERALELRWAWRAHAAWTLDARVRRRVALTAPAAALRRVADDLYMRATFRF